MNLAFLSYSHHDAKVAEWLQKSLEHFKLPKHLLNPVSPDCRSLRPIFRDRTDLSTGVLANVIDNNLENSLFLIVICSRRSARSEWVSKEVQYFFEHGKMDYVIPVVVDGIPYSGGSRECMPKYMCDYVIDHPEQELLCIDKVADGDNRALLHVVSRILEVPFDELYDRYSRRRTRRLALQIGGSILALALSGYFVTPIHPVVRITDVAGHLTHKPGSLYVDGQLYSINQYDTLLELPSVPGYLRGSRFSISFNAPFYDSISSYMELGYGISAECNITLSRDNSFSIFAGHVLDSEGRPVRDASVKVAGVESRTDFTGFFFIDLPPEVQAETQSIIIFKDGYEEKVREDECPSTELSYILHSAK